MNRQPLWSKFMTFLLTFSFCMVMVALCCGALKMCFIVFRWCFVGLWG